jgi:hypothetical protein
MKYSMGEQLTFSWAEPHANHSLSQDFERDLLTQEETLCSPFSLWLKEKSRGGLSGKMSPECCQVTEEGILVPSSGRWANSGMGSPTGFLTLNTSEWPKDAEESLLSDTLETGDLPERYYLSPKACQGILRRAEKRGKQLPQMLKEALEAVANRPE